MQSKLLKPAEVMEVLGIGRSLTYELIASGELPSIRLGKRCVRVSSLALDEWIRERGTGRSNVVVVDA